MSISRRIQRTMWKALPHGKWIPWFLLKPQRPRHWRIGNRLVRKP